MIARMSFIFARVHVVAGAAIILAGCGMADSHSSLPKVFRQPEQQAREPEPPPDVKRLVRDNIASVFAASAHPSDISVSPPRHDLHGSGWTACIKASVMGMSNHSIGTQTFVVAIENDKIWNRHRANIDDSCDSQTYEPL